MKKINLFLMTLLTFTMSMFCSSCGTDDVVDAILDKDKYFIVLEDVSTNLIDEKGNSIDQTLFNDFVFDNGQKNIYLGEALEAPLGAFEQSCENFRKALQARFDAQGGLPQDGWIVYSFTLRKDSPQGSVQSTKDITIY